MVIKPDIQKLTKGKWYAFAIKRLVEIEDYRADRSFRDSYTFSRLISNLHREVQEWLPLFNDVDGIAVEDRSIIKECLKYLMGGQYEGIEEIINKLN